MPTRGREVALPLRHAIVTCRLLFGCTFDAIERKTDVQSMTATKIMREPEKRAGNSDFHEVLACVGAIEGRGPLPRVPDDTQLSANIRNAMLKHPHTKPFQAVVDKENIEISGRKRPSRFLIETVQHQHTHVDEDNQVLNEIIRGRVAKKPRLNKSHRERRKKFCEHTLKEIANGAIYICSDKKYHEIEAKSGDENVTRSKRVEAERYVVAKNQIQFTIMQFDSHTTKQKPVIESIHL